VVGLVRLSCKKVGNVSVGKRSCLEKVIWRLNIKTSDWYIIETAVKTC
jgi:hypothetical protein